MIVASFVISGLSIVLTGMSVHYSCKARRIRREIEKMYR